MMNPFAKVFEVRRRMTSKCNRRSFDYALRAALRMTRRILVGRCWFVGAGRKAIELRLIPTHAVKLHEWGTRFVCTVTLVAWATAGAQSSVGGSLRRKLIPSNTNVATSSLSSYLERVKADTQSIQPTAGAIWTDSGRLTRLSSDVRAMRPHDLIAVVVQESLAASTDGTVKNQRASAANSAITGLIGAVKTSSALTNLLAQTSSNSLNATGASATNSSLTTTFGGQVIDVLPNGMLVIEAARQVEFSQQTQTIVLRGLVRPEDISQQNEVLSTAISSLELEVKGKGIVNDYTRRQNPVVRFIQSILVF